MSIRCVIIEDEPLARSLLTNYISKVQGLVLQESFANPLEALEYLKSNTVELLFVDIQMPEISGLSLLKIMPNKPDVILTTAFSEHALEGYDLNVVDYLLKPITLERFLVAVEKVQKRQRINEPLVTPMTVTQNAEDGSTNNIFIKDGTKLVKVNLNEIKYIEGLKDYVSIYTPDHKIVSLQRMKNLEVELPSDKFIRVHHSYIVAVKWIDAVHKDRIDIGKVSVPIGETYRKSFKDFMDKQRYL